MNYQGKDEGILCYVLPQEDYDWKDAGKTIAAQAKTLAENQKCKSGYERLVDREYLSVPILIEEADNNNVIFLKTRKTDYIKTQQRKIPRDADGKLLIQQTEDIMQIGNVIARKVRIELPVQDYWNLDWQIPRFWDLSERGYPPLRQKINRMLRWMGLYQAQVRSHPEWANEIYTNSIQFFTSLVIGEGYTRLPHSQEIFQLQITKLEKRFIGPKELRGNNFFQRIAELMYWWKLAKDIKFQKPNEHLYDYQICQMVESVCQAAIVQESEITIFDYVTSFRQDAGKIYLDYGESHKFRIDYPSTGCRTFISAKQMYPCNSDLIKHLTSRRFEELPEIIKNSLTLFFPNDQQRSAQAYVLAIEPNYQIGMYRPTIGSSVYRCDHFRGVRARPV